MAAPEDELRRLRGHGEVVHWAPAGHAVRPGDWAQQGQSTPDRVALALREDRLGDAAALVRHLVTEAQEIHDLYTSWSVAVPEILTRRGAAPRSVPEAVDTEADWERFLVAVEGLAGDCEAGVSGDHGPRLHAVLGAWREAHDRHLGLVAAWIGVAGDELGEAQLGGLWQELQADGIAGYRRYDTSHTRWEESFAFVVQTAIEGMHGHLGGPRRSGEVEVTDHGDRVQLTFAPCGSGGRLRAAERFGVTTQRHDWGWNETGVCHYCVHCCVLQQLEPIDNLGHPVRVIDPPLKPGDSCSWTVYRDPADIPASAYERVGRSKPKLRQHAEPAAVDDQLRARDEAGGV